MRKAFTKHVHGAKLTDMPVPSALGFRMPAEWERHDATWIAWPHNAADWPGKFAPIQWVYAEIVRHLHTSEKVHILVRGVDEEEAARRTLHRSGIDLNQVAFFQFSTNRVWTRDYCPIFLVRAGSEEPRIAATNWKFNAWARYPDWKDDDAIPDGIAERFGFVQWKPACPSGGRRVVLEGGSVDVNGAGLMLTTEECLLSEGRQQRNPGLSRRDYERVFQNFLGVRKVVWLRKGIAGDDTHGHVDDLARFTSGNTVVIVTESDPKDPNYAPLMENLALLREARNLRSRPFRIVQLPLPAPVVFNGQRLPASYANFYIANRMVLVPTFNDPNDRIALNTLQELFPKRKVCGIHSVDLVWGLGTLHCMTQQQPSVTPTH